MSLFTTSASLNAVYVLPFFVYNWYFKLLEVYVDSIVSKLPIIFWTLPLFERVILYKEHKPYSLISSHIWVLFNVSTIKLSLTGIKLPLLIGDTSISTLKLYVVPFMVVLLFKLSMAK